VTHSWESQRHEYFGGLPNDYRASCSRDRNILKAYLQRYQTAFQHALVRYSIVFEITHLNLLRSPCERFACVQVCDDWLYDKRPHARADAQKLLSPPHQSMSQLEKL
jgi:hypothetical protein